MHKIEYGHGTLAGIPAEGRAICFQDKKIWYQQAIDQPARDQREGEKRELLNTKLFDQRSNCHQIVNQGGDPLMVESIRGSMISDWIAYIDQGDPIRDRCFLGLMPFWDSPKMDMSIGKRIEFRDGQC